MAVAMTMWLLQLVLWGKAVWVSPAMPTQCDVCCPVLKVRVETGLPVGTLWDQWAGATAFGMAVATGTPITLLRSRNAWTPAGGSMGPAALRQEQLDIVSTWMVVNVVPEASRNLIGTG